MSHNIAPITPGLRSQAEAEAVAKAILEATTGGRGRLASPGGRAVPSHDGVSFVITT